MIKMCAFPHYIRVFHPCVLPHQSTNMMEECLRQEGTYTTETLSFQDDLSSIEQSFFVLGLIVPLGLVLAFVAWLWTKRNEFPINARAWQFEWMVVLFAASFLMAIDSAIRFMPCTYLLIIRPAMVLSGPVYGLVQVIHVSLNILRAHADSLATIESEYFQRRNQLNALSAFQKRLLAWREIFVRKRVLTGIVVMCPLVFSALVMMLVVFIEDNHVPCNSDDHNQVVVHDSCGYRPYLAFNAVILLVTTPAVISSIVMMQRWLPKHKDHTGVKIGMGIVFAWGIFMGALIVLMDLTKVVNELEIALMRYIMCWGTILLYMSTIMYYYYKYRPIYTKQDTSSITLPLNPLEESTGESMQVMESTEAPTREYLQQLITSMAERDKKMLRSYFVFLTKEHARENLLFLLELQSLRKLIAEEDTVQTRPHAKYTQIIKVFLVNTSPTQLNLPASLQYSNEDRRESVVIMNVSEMMPQLERIETHIVGLLVQDSFTRWFYSRRQ